MYISELTLKNFRGFKKETSIVFNEKMNVLIGANNTGKTSIISALNILFGNDKKRLDIDDFNKNISIDELKKNSPKIVISVKLSESENESDFSEDLVTISTWLTKIERPYEAKLIYEFFLPKKNEEEYKKSLENIQSDDIGDYWNEIEQNFLRKYTPKFFIGDIINQTTLDPESIKKFDFQFLDAIRDVERDLFTGKTTLLREVMDFFIDYDIKTKDIDKVEKEKKINERKKDFNNESIKLIESLQKRMEAGKDEMLEYVTETGAGFENLTPSFEGKILDTELFSALKLIVESESGLKLPATKNGLGYNNLIFISLLLAKMQKNVEVDYLGDNAKIYSILAIQEPEAHLHPNMQYKFLKFLNDNEKNTARQIFITTHSPNITAAINLDDIIVLNKINDEIKIAYPGKVFENNKDSKNYKEDQNLKRYLERFLDVTRADMLFAKSLILVEGISEQILLPEFADSEGMNLSDLHISIINIGGRVFNPFLKYLMKLMNLLLKKSCMYN